MMINFTDKAALDLEKDLKTYTHVWITEAILIEIGNTFSKSNKDQVSDFIQYCYESPIIDVVNTHEGLLRQALIYSNTQTKTGASPIASLLW